MENIDRQKRGLSGSTLKIIAIITMLIDHVGATVMEKIVMSSETYKATETAYRIMIGMRSIGRIAFPIFCFLLVEGFLHTSNIKKYIIRLFSFALISEIPFDFAFNNKIIEFTHQNVFFTLLIGVLAMWAISYCKNRFKDDRVKYIGSAVAIFIISSAIAEFIRCDYGAIGIAVIILMYILREYKVLKALSVYAIFVLHSGFEGLQTLAVFAFIPISFYSGKKGISLKYFFYAFYPIHLLILGFIVRYVM